jgi:hypothetical protein
MRWPEEIIADDNQADALWIMDLGLAVLSIDKIQPINT